MERGRGVKDGRGGGGRARTIPSGRTIFLPGATLKSLPKPRGSCCSTSVNSDGLEMVRASRLGKGWQAERMGGVGKAAGALRRHSCYAWLYSHSKHSRTRTLPPGPIPAGERTSYRGDGIPEDSSVRGNARGAKGRRHAEPGKHSGTNGRSAREDALELLPGIVVFSIGVQLHCFAQQVVGVARRRSSGHAG